MLEAYTKDFDTAAKTGIISYVCAGNDKLTEYRLKETELGDIKEELQLLEKKLQNT